MKTTRRRFLQGSAIMTAACGFVSRVSLTARADNAFRRDETGKRYLTGQEASDRSVFSEWWMRQVEGSPHWGNWPPDLPHLHGLTRELLSDGLAEDRGWIRATVPGSVQGALIANGSIPQPWYQGMNMRVLEKATVGKQSWFFRRFRVPTFWRGKRIRLEFRAVDYRAHFYLNGKWLGEHEGHFSPAVFDISQTVYFDQINTLAVELDAFPYDSPKPISQIRPLAAQFARSQILCNAFGLDFAPATCPLGITDDVFLVAGDEVLIDDICVRSELSSDLSQAKLNVEIQVDSTVSGGRIVQVEVASQQPPAHVIQTKVLHHFKLGKNLVKASVELTHPEIWWPNGSGQQNLYTVTVRIIRTGRPTTVLHTASTSVGVRKLEMAFNQGHDLSPYPWTFVINGRRVYVKGGGWVPMDPFHRMETHRYDQFMTQAKAANFNFIRWWGGGVPERSAFYDLCDRYGLMIMHDFFLANNNHDNARFLGLLDDQASAFVRLRRNHPSIVLWNTGNELWNDAPNVRSQNKLWKTTTTLDPNRSMHPSSPTIGETHGITSYYYDPDRDYAVANRFGLDRELARKLSGTFPNYKIYGQPLNDIYRSWITRLEERGFNPRSSVPDRNAFGLQIATEGGASVVANYTTLKNIIPDEELKQFDSNHPSPSWLFHNAEPGDYDWLQNRRTLEMFGPIADLPTYVMMNQFSRAQIISYGLEELRRGKFGFSGTSMWQFNETWPNAAGNALVDFFGIPRLTYEFVKRAYEPVHPSLRFERVKWKPGEQFSAELWATSDVNEDLPGCVLDWKIIDALGYCCSKGNVDFNLWANKSLFVGKLTWNIPANYDSFFIVYYSIRRKPKGETVSANDFLFTAHTSTPHCYALLLTAPPARIKMRLMHIEQRSARVVLENTGTVNGLLCHCSLDLPDGSTLLASSNYFNLAPGDRRTVEIDTFSLTGSNWSPNWKTLRYEGLNVPVTQPII